MSAFFPVHTVQRAITVYPPRSAAPFDVIDAVRAELVRQGNRVRTAGHGRIEFDGPSLLGAMGTLSAGRRAASLVRGGTVVFDPADPGQIHLELRYSWAVWAWPLLIACIVVLQEMDAGTRLGAILVVAGFVIFQVKGARQAYERWIAEAAGQAGTR